VLQKRNARKESNKVIAFSVARISPVMHDRLEHKSEMHLIPWVPKVGGFQ
jgi:hypothetical protein